MKLIGKLFSRVVLVSLAIALQLAWLFLMMWFLSDIYLPMAVVLTLISIVAAVAIINRPGSPGVKLAWIVPIMAFPLFGGIIFLISGGKGPRRKLKRALDKSFDIINPYVEPCSPRDERADFEDGYSQGQCHYLADYGFPLYGNTTADYDDGGRAAWERMLSDLRAAERFIFMEYFIIRPGVMWDAVLDVLKEKAAVGVEVRVMYDDLGTISYLPRKYAAELESFGIKCHAFNRYRPVYSVVMDHRDHRKILVIDGHIAYTGGINFADEYIGEEVRFGNWKDNSVRLHGEGVRSMTLMFLHLWNAARPTDTVEGVAAYMPRPEDVADVTCEGVVQPYGSSDSRE